MKVAHKVFVKENFYGLRIRAEAVKIPKEGEFY